MKNSAIFFVFNLLLPVSVLGQSGTYTLTGKIGNPTQGMAYLRCIDDSSRAIDSATIASGSFTFSGNVKQPLTTLLYLAKPGVRYGPGYMPTVKLYLEPGNIHLTSPDSVAHLTISGTPRNEAITKLNRATYVCEQQLMQLKIARYGATPTQRRDTVHMHYLDRQITAAEIRRYEAIKHFIQNNPNSPVSLDALNEHRGNMFNLAETEALFNSLAPTVRRSQVGLQCALFLARARSTAIGSLAPDFSQNDATGKLVSLHEFRGQYVLLDFWASWCGPCRSENSNLVTVFNQYKGRNFTILGVSLDQDRTWWLNAITNDRLSWPQVSDLKMWKNEVAQLYAIESVPQNFLLGPDGRIIAKDLHPEELAKLLASVLSGNKP